MGVEKKAQSKKEQRERRKETTEVRSREVK